MSPGLQRLFDQRAHGVGLPRRYAAFAFVLSLLLSYGCGDDPAFDVGDAGSTEAGVADTADGGLGDAADTLDAGTDGDARADGAADAPPMLIVNAEGDAATPMPNAEAMQSALDNGSHLLRWEDRGHGVITQSACTREVVQGFMVDPNTAPDTTTCSD